MSSQETNPNSPNNPPNSSVVVQGKKSHTSLYVLAGLMALAGAAVYFVPKVLVEMYHAEEEAKRRGTVVGSRTDVTPPPGFGDPYRGMPGRGDVAPAEKADEK
jgi:hypothetical protein